MDYTSKINIIDKYIKTHLSLKRYKHSKEVASMSSRIATITDNDSQKSYLAGLSHDIAREFSKSQLLDKIKKIDFSKDFYKLPQLFHGPVGADFLISKFGILEKDILDSVRYHSFGFPDMCDLAKIVYVADYISMDRTHILENERLEILSCSLNEMVVIVVDKTRAYLFSRGETILPETDNMYKKIIRILSEKETGI